MTYQEYVTMVNEVENLNKDQFSFFMTVESISDIILCGVHKDGQTLEEAIERAQKETGAPQNEMEVAIASAKEQLRLFKECEDKGHDYESEDHANTETGYTGAFCKRCGFSFGTTLY